MELILDCFNGYKIYTIKIKISYFQLIIIYLNASGRHLVRKQHEFKVVMMIIIIIILPDNIIVVCY